MTKIQWTETSVAACLARHFQNRSLLIVPNTTWTGSEADLLCIERKSLRIIDVEIKISRADLRADPGKDKWWVSRPWSRVSKSYPRDVRKWPDKVWKHYYAMPHDIWSKDLLATLPEMSGVVLLRSAHRIEVVRHAKPCRDAKPISAADAIDLARLASFRLWNALEREQAAALSLAGVLGVPAKVAK